MNDYCLVFEDGHLILGDPLNIKDADNWPDFLTKAGYHQTQIVGDDSGLSFVLWESDGGWAIVFSTAGRGCLIVCNDWISLLDCLAKLSPIALAGMMQDGGSKGPAFFPVRQVEEYPRR